MNSAITPSSGFY